MVDETQLADHVDDATLVGHFLADHRQQMLHAMRCRVVPITSVSEHNQPRLKTRNPRSTLIGGAAAATPFYFFAAPLTAGRMIGDSFAERMWPYDSFQRCVIRQWNFRFALPSFGRRQLYLHLYQQLDRRLCAHRAQTAPLIEQSESAGTARAGTHAAAWRWSNQ